MTVGIGQLVLLRAATNRIASTRHSRLFRTGFCVDVLKEQLLFG